MNGAPKGACYWVTGLSAAGKTTVSVRFADKLRRRGAAVVLLDGDVLRSVFATSAYKRSERIELGQTYGRLCQMLVQQGITVIIAVIGLFHELHRWNRENIENYVEVFLDVPIEELERRDPKKIYEKARAGHLRDVAGLDMEVEFPKLPDLHLKWDADLKPELVVEIMLEHYESSTFKQS